MFTNNQIPRCTPEEQGVSSVAISGFLEAAEAAQLELHSLMILRHAHVIAQGWWPPYRPEDVRLLFSATKTFTSTAVGFAVSEGYITLEDKVISFFPEYAPEAVHRHLEAMTIRHLLTMSPGHSKPSFGIDYRRNKGSWVRHFLQELEIDHPPGSRFVYSGGPSHMLSAIVQKVTGQTLLQYLQPRLLNHWVLWGPAGKPILQASAPAVSGSASRLRILPDSVSCFCKEEYGTAAESCQSNGFTMPPRFKSIIPSMGMVINLVSVFMAPTARMVHMDSSVWSFRSRIWSLP